MNVVVALLGYGNNKRKGICPSVDHSKNVNKCKIQYHSSPTFSALLSWEGDFSLLVDLYSNRSNEEEDWKDKEDERDEEDEDEDTSYSNMLKCICNVSLNNIIYWTYYHSGNNGQAMLCLWCFQLLTLCLIFLWCFNLLRSLAL